MADKEYLLKLMYRAFLDIRVASHSKDSHTCFVLSDIFHNVPLQMNQAEKGEKSYADIVIWIQRKIDNCMSGRIYSGREHSSGFLPMEDGLL